MSLKYDRRFSYQTNGGCVIAYGLYDKNRYNIFFFVAFSIIIELFLDLSQIFLVFNLLSSFSIPHAHIAKLSNGIWLFAEIGY